MAKKLSKAERMRMTQAERDMHDQNVKWEESQQIREAEQDAFYDRLIERLYLFKMTSVGDVIGPDGTVLVSGSAIDTEIRRRKANPKDVTKPTLWPYVYSEVWQTCDQTSTYKVFIFNEGMSHHIAFYHLKAHETFQLRVKRVGMSHFSYGDSRRLGDKFTSMKRDEFITTLARMMFSDAKKSDTAAEKSEKAVISLAKADKFIKKIELSLFIM